MAAGLVTGIAIDGTSALVPKKAMVSNNAACCGISARPLGTTSRFQATSTVAGM